MIRKLLLPLAALVLLAGCATGYSYRAGNGDYYHGTPRVEYRHHYPYGYYGPYRYDPYTGRYYGHPYRYRSYRYGYPYYGHPYYGHPYYTPRPVYRRPVQPRVDTTPDRPRSPWRDLDSLRDRNGGDARGIPDRAERRVDTPRPTSMPAPRTQSGDDGSAIGGMLRRTRERDHRNATP